MIRVSFDTNLCILRDQFINQYSNYFFQSVKKELKLDSTQIPMCRPAV